MARKTSKSKPSKKAVAMTTPKTSGVGKAGSDLAKNVK
jgi:hypothetical protein